MGWKIILIAGIILLSGDLYAKKVDGKTVPFHGVFSGYLLGFNENPVDIALRCDPPAGKIAWAITSFEGWGTATHMGSSYIYAEHCSYTPEVGLPDGTYGEGQFFTVADNKENKRHPSKK